MKRVILTLFIFIIAILSTSAQMKYTQWPSSFQNTTTNKLLYSSSLDDFFLKLRTGFGVRVMMIGDSHVKGNYLPKAVGDKLTDYFPDPLLSFTYYGINGAMASRYLEEDMLDIIGEEQPDLLIVSFGTNEAHGSFDGDRNYDTYATLLRSVKAICPQCDFILTTPPGSHFYRSTPNEVTEEVARCIATFGKDQHVAVWDLYNMAGGVQSACSNWRNAGLMQFDLIHYTAEAYQLQGTLLAEAIIKAFRKSMKNK